MTEGATPCVPAGGRPTGAVSLEVTGRLEVVSMSRDGCAVYVSGDGMMLECAASEGEALAASRLVGRPASVRVTISG